MHFIEAIGKDFETLDIDPKEYSIEFEDWMIEEGLQPYWSIESNNKSFEIRLTADKKITSIWLYPINGKFKLNNYSTSTTRKDIRREMGEPSSKGDSIKNIIDNKLVDWDKYNKNGVSIHFEYSSLTSKLTMITLMDNTVES